MKQNTTFLPGIFKGTEFVMNPEDGMLYVIENGTTVLFKDYDNELVFEALDKAMASNKKYKKNVPAKMAQNEKRFWFVHCFLAGYDNKPDYDDEAIVYDFNKNCKLKGKCPFNQMCKSITHLTDRENSVLNYIQNGYTTMAIAATLGIKMCTTNIYIASLYRKFGVQCRSELVIKTKDLGII